MTSQVASFFAQAISFHVRPIPLSIEESSRLLLELTQYHDPSEQDVDSAKRISDIVGRLPIAIAHMAGYMFTSRTTLQELQQRLETGEAYSIWLKAKTWTTPLYEQALDRVWHIALEELSAPSRELLYVISMLSPDAIPDEVLIKWASSSLDPDLRESEKKTRSVVRVL